MSANGVVDRVSAVDRVSQVDRVGQVDRAAPSPMTAAVRRTWLRRTSRAPVLLSTAVLVATLAILPVGTHPLAPTVSFLPAVLSVVACFDLLSVYLLAGEYRDTGDPRLLAMCVAYLWSLTLMGGYALSFPGVFGAEPPLATTAQVAPWLYLGWHAGFPALLGAAWMPWPQGLPRVTDQTRRRFVSLTAMAVAVVVAVGTVTLAAVCARFLPVIIQGRDTSRMTQLTAPVVLPMVALALVAAWAGTRRRTGPETWSAVAILVCLCDLVMTYAARHRFSVGWYAGRALTVTAAAVILFAMLAGFRRLKSNAEINAAYDSLTGLANRRSTHDALDRLYAAARRAPSPLGVICLDLDLFKQVNDRYGHAAGDAVLSAVGRALAGALRAGDLVGRVGGEEFLALLPNTDARGSMLVAERLRQEIAAIDIPAAGGRGTASLGVACLELADGGSGDLLRRADQALYRAKAAGRGRVVLAGTEPAPVGS